MERYFKRFSYAIIRCVENEPIEISGGEQLEVVKCLVENGADINATNNNGISALMWASYNGYSEIVNYLVGNGAIE